MAEARLLLAELDALRGELGRPHGRGAKRRGVEVDTSLL